MIISTMMMMTMINGGNDYNSAVNFFAAAAVTIAFPATIITLDNDND